MTEQEMSNRVQAGTNNPHEMTNRKPSENEGENNEPLSGSKQVKNQNHSRNNQGEGS